MIIIIIYSFWIKSFLKSVKIIRKRIRLKFQMHVTKISLQMMTQFSESDRLLAPHNPAHHPDYHADPSRTSHHPADPSGTMMYSQDHLSKYSTESLARLQGLPGGPAAMDTLSRLSSMGHHGAAGKCQDLKIVNTIMIMFGFVDVSL